MNAVGGPASGRVGRNPASLLASLIYRRNKNPFWKKKDKRFCSQCLQLLVVGKRTGKKKRSQKSGRHLPTCESDAPFALKKTTQTQEHVRLLNRAAMFAIFPITFVLQ